MLGLKAWSVIIIAFYRNYKGGLIKLIQDDEDGFTELVLLRQKTCNDDNIKKRQSVRNSQNIGMVDMVFEKRTILIIKVNLQEWKP
jgi:HKD family nuclease